MSFPPPPHSFMFNTHEDHDHLPSTSLNVFPSLPPQHFQQVGAPFLLERSMSFSGIGSKCDHEMHGGDDELSDDGFQCGEKKKRLNLEQVKALEKSFELGNKLEPDRKVQLAKALGLQPRQIAIWFQNRRARWKTKQLEKEYEVLKKQFEAVKIDNHALKLQNQKLHSELQALKGRDWCEAGRINIKKETEGSWSNGSDNGSDINLDLLRTPALNSRTESSQNGKSLSLVPNSLKPTNIPQLLQFNSKPDPQDQGFSNMLIQNIDEQHNFWPWPEQHHFN